MDPIPLIPLGDWTDADDALASLLAITGRIARCASAGVLVASPTDDASVKRTRTVKRDVTGSTPPSGEPNASGDDAAPASRSTESASNDDGSTTADSRPPAPDDVPGPLASAVATLLAGLEDRSVKHVEVARGALAEMLERIRQEDAPPIVVLGIPPGPKRTERIVHAQRALRDLEAEVIVVAPHARRTPLDTIVVPQVAGSGADAITRALQWASDEGRITVLPDPDRASRSRRTADRARERARTSALDRIRIDDDPRAGDLAARIRATPIDAASTAVLACEFDHVSALTRALDALDEADPALDEPAPRAAPAIIVVRSAGDRVERFRDRVADQWRRFAPPLDREGRTTLSDSINESSDLDADFLVPMLLSAAIATFGLALDSGAVIIGAMLVAPLMMPMVGLGLALVQGNTRLFKASLKSIAIGVASAVVLAFLIGLIVPAERLPDEVLARSHPNLLDLGVAICAGLAGAYFLSRPGLSSSLGGVAIAVALVPPLASVGLACSFGAFQIARGAAVLFTTNLAAIVLASAVVFRLFGMRSVSEAGAVPLWLRFSSATLAGLLALLAVVLGERLAVEGVGATMPEPTAISRLVHAATMRELAQHPGTRLLEARRVGVGLEDRVELVLVAEQPITPTLRDSLGSAVRDALDDPLVDVEITILQAVPLR